MVLGRQLCGDAADILDMKFQFEKNPEFQGVKEESVRHLYHWLREQERRPPSNPVSESLLVMKEAFKSDSHFAEAWHDNVAVQAIDCGVDHALANKIASRVMRHLFDVDTTGPAAPVVAAPPQQTAVRSPEAGPASSDPPAS